MSAWSVANSILMVPDSVLSPILSSLRILRFSASRLDRRRDPRAILTVSTTDDVVLVLLSGRVSSSEKRLDSGILFIST